MITGAQAAFAVALLQGGLSSGAFAAIAVLALAALASLLGIAVGRWVSERRGAAQRDALLRCQAMADARAESEANYRSLVDHLPVAVAIVQDGRIAFANRAASALMRADSPGALLGRDPYEFVARRDHERLSEILRAHVSGEATRPSYYVATLLRADGEEFECEQYVTDVVFNGRPAQQFAGIDLTVRRLAQEALRISEERLQLAMDATSDGLWDRNLVTGASYYSPRWYTMLGYSPDEFPAGYDTWVGLLHPDDREAAVKGITDLVSGRESLETEFRMRRKDGGWCWVLSRSKVTLRDAQGQAVRLVGTHIDITDRKRAEEEHHRLETQILETQKLESIGLLAGGIAHDFNNLLTVIIGNASMLQADTMPNSVARNQLDQIMLSSRRAADLCREMLAYAGRGLFRRGMVDLNKLVREMGGLLSASLPRHVRFVYDLAEPVSPIEGDGTQIRQVFMNLVTNASEAIGDREGSILIRTGTRHCDVEYLSRVRLGRDLPPQRYVLLEVSDTGSGISQTDLGKIFDPFYTTKFAGRGLGLAAVLGIMRRHRGGLAVSSRKGEGSTFTLLFPSAGAADGFEPETSPRSPAVALRGEGLVLVVDDEPQVVELAVEMLHQSGFKVLTAEDGREAVALYRQHAPEIRAVLLDVTMPGMSGRDAYAQIRSLDPRACVILSSGYVEEDAVDPVAFKGIAGFLQKPYSAAELAAKLQAALALTPGSARPA